MISNVVAICIFYNFYEKNITLEKKHILMVVKWTSLSRNQLVNMSSYILGGLITGLRKILLKAHVTIFCTIRLLYLISTPFMDGHTFYWQLLHMAQFKLCKWPKQVLAKNIINSKILQLVIINKTIS